MGKAEAYLIPGRFAITVGHFLVVLMLSYHIDAITGNAPDATPYVQEAAASLKTAWTVSVVCFVFDFLGLFGGFSIFFRSFNLIQSVLHFLGALYTSWFILYSWDYHLYWKICGVFNILPAILEFLVIINIFVLKNVPY